MSQTRDLRQMRLLEPYEHLTPEDREDISRLAIRINTLRRVEEAVESGHVATPTFIPDFYANKNYIEVLQWLSFYAIRGYLNENRKPAPLYDIYQRVAEKIRSAQREGAWPRCWKIPGRSTIDRRVNEIASANPLENRIMKGTTPRAISTRPGEYCPNPALYEDVAKILEARPP